MGAASTCCWTGPARHHVRTGRHGRHHRGRAAWDRTFAVKRQGHLSPGSTTPSRPMIVAPGRAAIRPPSARRLRPGRAPGQERRLCPRPRAPSPPFTKTIGRGPRGRRASASIALMRLASSTRRWPARLRLQRYADPEAMPGLLEAAPSHGPHRPAGGGGRVPALFLACDDSSFRHGHLAVRRRAAGRRTDAEEAFPPNRIAGLRAPMCYVCPVDAFSPDRARADGGERPGRLPNAPRGRKMTRRPQFQAASAFLVGPMRSCMQPEVLDARSRI